MAEPRHAIHAQLSAPAYDAWQHYATEAGVSITGLLEAIGHHLAAVDATGADLGDYQPDLLQAARRIDASHRRRTFRP